MIKELPGAERLLAAIAYKEIFMSSVTVFELTLRKSNLKIAEDFISGTQVLSFNEREAKIASSLEKGLSDRGLTIGWKDLFIAATAMANDCELATLNRKDFENIPGLRLVEF
ncbi:type II toxin-antitoxin system VapC family toxin [Candidatus Woesearchaeota archaeon]|nr:type II toxin-antitoxin system VapC family toxin [Candidatus Woesearchaeota archaeon]